jgi:hypothetical protein
VCSSDLNNFSKRLKINFFCPVPKGWKLIFFAPFRVGANEENQFYPNYINKVINNR